MGLSKFFRRMRAVFLLAFFVFIQISCGESQNNEIISELGEVIDRQVREAGQSGKKKTGKNQKSKVNKKRKRKGKKKKKPTKKRNNVSGKDKKKKKKQKFIKKKKTNGGKTKKKVGKRGKNDKEGKKHRKIEKKGENTKNEITKKKKKGVKKTMDGRKISKKKSEVKTSPGSRQTDAECFTSLCEKSKKFNLYQTQMRKAKRIKTWVDQMDKKKDKALTTFKNASTAIQSSTSGAQCNGASVPDEAKVADEKLTSCNTTASELCTSSKVSGLNTSLLEECIPKLQAYVDAYKACLKKCECSCFTALALVSDTCTKFNTMESSTKVAKRKCTSPSETGSFGDCRTQERKVAYYGEKCKPDCPGTLTTKAPGVVGRFLQERMQRHSGRM